MKKKLFFICIAIILCFTISIKAENPHCQWAEKIAGTGRDETSSIITDANGNVYVTGSFYSATLTFNNGITLSNSGYRDGYLAKYNLSGVCQWAEKIAGTDLDLAASISTDANGNVYVAGRFESPTLTFNNEITLSSSGSSDGYLAKYNTDGVCQWAEEIAGTGFVEANSISTDANGNVYVAGRYNTTQLTFNNGITLTNIGSSDGYLVKYNSSGVCQWAEKIAGDSPDYASSIITDASYNVYIAGQYNSSALAFNNGITLSNTDESDAYIAKYDSSGVCQWAKKIAGLGYDYANSISTDANGNVYVGGHFNYAALIFNNGITLSNSGSEDGYIAKYNSSGVCQWAEKIAGTSWDYAHSISTDANGNAYVAGYFNSATLTFNNGITLSNSGQLDDYIAKYNGSGVCQWAEKIAGTYFEYSHSISSDANGNVYVAGYFQSSILSFNDGITLTNSGEYDGFIAKYTESLPITSPLLTSPENNATNRPLNPTLEWQPVENAVSYTLQVSLTNDFATTIVNESAIESTEFEVNNLAYSTQYYWRLNATDGEQTSDWSEIWSFTTEGEPLDVLEIKLKNGWNLISSNVIPGEPAMESVFDGMNNIVVVKNQDGQVYSPSFGINQIGNWDITQGYYVYVSSSSILQIEGILVNPIETPINLNQGWNLVSYLRNSEMLAPDALQGISGSLLFVKDRMGNIYHPGFGINTIGNMQPGQGYWIYMNAPAVLTYPGN